MLVDSHCHLDFPDLSDRLPEVLGRARAAGVGRMITISTRISQAARYRALAEAHEEVLFTVGTHPHNAGEEPDVPAAEIVALAAHPRCVAIGEAGLDFHYDRAPRDVQERVFRTHIAAARESGLPLVIHARDADGAMDAILRDEHRRGRFDAVLHCFSSGEALARTGIELGFYISLSGILTFRSSEALRRIAAEIVPRDRLLVETDAPYLAPVPHRGRPNEPAYVVETARVLADLLGLGLDEVARLTTDNVGRLFAKSRPFLQDAARSAAA
ncbi:TatD family hydrolase [Enterovirga sp.]|uniref:TatD family hydrolase n=1 Tax=Enterovirga sp. TaxID=2026350 RepID=UPI002610FBCC|nr:TatD family hydrolase [Enterovirga sp.]MDB5591499.1 hydrolase, TatD family [Enterovirga sp.]